MAKLWDTVAEKIMDGHYCEVHLGFPTKDPCKQNVVRLPGNLVIEGDVIKVTVDADLSGVHDTYTMTIQHRYNSIHRDLTKPPVKDEEEERPEPSPDEETEKCRTCRRKTRDVPEGELDYDSSYDWCSERELYPTKASPCNKYLPPKKAKKPKGTKC